LPLCLDEIGRAKACDRLAGRYVFVGGDKDRLDQAVRGRSDDTELGGGIATVPGSDNSVSPRSGTTGNVPMPADRISRSSSWMTMSLDTPAAGPASTEAAAPNDSEPSKTIMTIRCTVVSVLMMLVLVRIS
jgi:hypothetical protein